MFRNILKKIRYVLEALIVSFGLWFFKVLGLKKSTAISSVIANFVGKKIAVNQLACKNLQLALPYLNDQQRNKIIESMWNNLGRIVGEFVHICQKTPQQIQQLCEVDDESMQVIEFLKKADCGAIVFSGHLGNWEIGPKLMMAMGLKVNVVYRPLNNPYVEEMTAKLRQVKMIEKGVNGTRKIIEALQNKEIVIILADQKISEGQRIKFFHQEADTTTSIARMALKYDVPVIPARVIRKNNDFNFRVEFEKPLEFKKTMMLNDDITSLTLTVNQTLERWITQYPEQWFWVHNRWK